MLYKVWGIELKTQSAPNPENLAEKEKQFYYRSSRQPANDVADRKRLTLRWLSGYIDYIGGFHSAESGDNSGPSPPGKLGARALSSLILHCKGTGSRSSRK